MLFITDFITFKDCKCNKLWCKIVIIW